MSYQTDLPCLVCSTTSKQRTFHHVKTRKSGGTDDDFNLMPLCFFCHEKIHKSPLSEFTNKYPQVKQWLLSNGWEFSELNKKWVRYK